MGALQDKVCVITGAGRGIGRAHALLMAAEGAKVVVNDLGAAADGSGNDAGPAAEVVEEIREAGGRAVASTSDISTWRGAEELVATALSEFGDLHVLVNNAGFLRDRTIVKMTEQEWDSVIGVHLKGHFAPLHFAAAYWRGQARGGIEVPRSVINTTSPSGLFAQPGQSNYAAAKSAIATLTMVADSELRRYGVRVNAIAPAAATRMTADQGLSVGDSTEWSMFDPANISPMVAYLAEPDCPIHGRMFFVMGGEVHLFQPWHIVDSIRTEQRFTLDELRSSAAKFADHTFDYGHPMGQAMRGELPA